MQVSLSTGTFKVKVGNMTFIDGVTLVSGNFKGTKTNSQMK